jgi:hypothetical protein
MPDDLPILLVDCPRKCGELTRRDAARTLGDLARRLAIKPLADAPALATITGVTHRSAAVQAGDVYAALPGTHTHGARFATDAAARGAVAIMTDAEGLAIATAFWRNWRSAHPEQYPEDVEAQPQGQGILAPSNGAVELPAPALTQEVSVPPAIDPSA